MKFSSSLSKEEARFLKELALSLINRKSASAESLTPLQPFDIKENALDVDELPDGGGEGEDGRGG